MRRIGDAVVHNRVLVLVLLVLVFLLGILMVNSSSGTAATPSPSPSQVLFQLSLSRGFKATPNPRIISSSFQFQHLLVDSTGNYSFGFLRVNKTLLSLAILHLPSSVTLWQAKAKANRFPTWSTLTHLFFNGSLVLSSSDSLHSDVVYWSTYTDHSDAGGGYRVFLSNTSNLQITSSNHVLLWSSFDYPTDTLVENQNLTSDMFLLSSNSLYSLRLGSDFMGLYSTTTNDHIYWKHKALQAKAQIIPGQGPIYAVLKSDGFLGMYQLQLLIINGSINYSSSLIPPPPQQQQSSPVSVPVPVPVDVQSFYSYQQPFSGVRRLRLEPDGNLRGYFWTGSTWILDYEAILPDDACDLPNSCGSYGLCNPGAKEKEDRCSCLDKQTKYNPNSDYHSCVGHVAGGRNQQQKYGDFCSPFISKYKTLRRVGVELPYKELMSYKKMKSLQECEGECEHNCTCWGAVYSNSSGFCYLLLDYPIGTLVVVGDETKVGYFKLRETVSAASKGKMNAAVAALMVVLVLLLMFAGVLGFWWWWGYRNRNNRRRRGVVIMSGYVVDDDNVGVGPYKDLGAASFRSIQLSEM